MESENKQNEPIANPMDEVDTRRLVDELSRRGGVETSALSANADAVFRVSGPARVLVVVD